MASQHHPLAAVLSGAVLGILLWPAILSATDYEVTVSREGKNLYLIDGKDVLLRTRACVEYADIEPGRLMIHGHEGKLRFLRSGEECSVHEVFGPVTQVPGEYPVGVHVITSEWLRLEQNDLHLKLADPGWRDNRREFEARLRIGEDGAHQLLFHGKVYEVEGLYTAIEL